MSLQPLIDDALVVQQVMSGVVDLRGPATAVPSPRQSAQGEPAGSPGPELADRPA